MSKEADRIVIYSYYCLDCHLSFMDRNMLNGKKRKCKYCGSAKIAGPRMPMQSPQEASRG